MAVKGIKSLCTPAFFYFIVSMVFLFIVYAQNYNNSNVYCLGMYSCDVSSVWLIFIMKFVYVLFWTWVLNLICIAGIPAFSWFLVLFPFLFMIILIMYMLTFK